MLRFPPALSMATALFLLALPAAAGNAGADPRDAALMLRALQAACPSPTPDPAVAALAGEAAGEPDTGAVQFGLGLSGWRLAQPLAGGGAIRISRLASAAGLQRIVAELDRPPQPGLPARALLQIRAERDCDDIDARLLVWREDGSLSEVALLDRALRPTGRTLALDPPVPEGEDPGGVTLALLDTGVNYLQPAIAARLARDAAGNAIGYDFEDDDPRPFDVNAALSPFNPGRHGTMVANALLLEAAPLRLIALRHPGSRPQRLADAVTLAAENGARLLLVGVGGRREADWRGFASALRDNPQILAIVSAGRDGENIDDRAYYPAALALPNMLTVGAADGFGQPVRSNWGSRRVDLLAPAERLIVRDFDGFEAIAGGAEFAAARVAALASRLLASEPGLDTEALKARILALARLSDHGGPARSAYGVLPEEALAR